MDLERTMQFILEMQAKLEASVAKHDEQIARNSEQIAKHDEQISTLAASVTTLTDLVGRIAQAEIRLVERMETGFRELHEIQATTDYKLNALIDTVDKLVRRNGHSQ
jgi:chromosome segregation ATPase